MARLCVRSAREGRHRSSGLRSVHQSKNAAEHRRACRRHKQPPKARKRCRASWAALISDSRGKLRRPEGLESTIMPRTC
eukprot:4628950-Pyramimonas_sp.AAC.1